MLTVTVPSVEPTGTIASNSVELTQVTDVAGVPLKVTVVPWVKFDPVIMTFVPIGPLDGFRLEITGAKIVTWNESEEAQVPPGVVT